MANKKNAAPETVEEKVEQTTPETVETDDGFETIVVPKDPGNKKDTDKFVGVNGKRYQIMRGNPVRVPKEVAEVLKLANLAEEEADAYLEQLED